VYRLYVSPFYPTAGILIIHEHYILAPHSPIITVFLILD